MGGKALLYFEVVTTLALAIGLLVVNFVQPGSGMNVDPGHAGYRRHCQIHRKAAGQSTVDFILHIIPQSAVGPFAEGESCKYCCSRYCSAPACR